MKRESIKGIEKELGKLKLNQSAIAVFKKVKVGDKTELYNMYLPMEKSGWKNIFGNKEARDFLTSWADISEQDAIKEENETEAGSD